MYGTLLLSFLEWSGVIFWGLVILGAIIWGLIVIGAKSEDEIELNYLKKINQNKVYH